MLGIKPADFAISILCNACRNTCAPRAVEFVSLLSVSRQPWMMKDKSKCRLPFRTALLIQGISRLLVFWQHEMENLEQSFPMIVMSWVASLTLSYPMDKRLVGDGRTLKLVMLFSLVCGRIMAQDLPDGNPVPHF